MLPIRRLLPAALLVLTLAPALAVAQGESRTHTVRKGDTLWDLAQQYLGDPFRWPEIYRRNQSTIQDPNLIYPDQVIVISGEVVATAGTPADTTGGMPSDTAAGGVGEVPGDTTDMEPLLPQVPMAPPAMTIFNPARYRVVRGEREALRIRSSAPAVRPGDFLQAPFMWDPNGVVGAGTLGEGSSTDGIGITKTQRPIQYMEEVWVTVPQGAAGAVDDRYLLVRCGPVVEGQGRVVVPTGVVRVLQSAADGRARAILVAKFEDVFAGHLVMPLDTLEMEPDVRPARVEFGLATKISYLYGDPVLPPVGHQIIFAATARDGIVPGDQLTLQVPANTSAAGAVLPAQDVAVAQVTRVTPWGVSAIIVSQTDGGIKTGMAARVTAKMP